jgi:hypothetical protein
VIPRLKALGADMDRVFIWRPPFAGRAPLCIPGREGQRRPAAGPRPTRELWIASKKE